MTTWLSLQGYSAKQNRSDREKQASYDITYMLLFSHPVVSDSVSPWTAAHQASLSLTISQSFPKFMLIASVMLSSHLILWHSLLLLPSVFPCIRDLSNELSVCIRLPKYWSFSFSISPSNQCSGLISLKIDWFDLAVQGTIRSLLQHHSLKASILPCSAFFTVQLSQLCVTTGKTTASTIRTFVCSYVSAFQHTMLVIAFCWEAIVFWFHGCSHPPQWL